MPWSVDSLPSAFPVEKRSVELWAGAIGSATCPPSPGSLFSELGIGLLDPLSFCRAQGVEVFRLRPCSTGRQPGASTVSGHTFLWTAERAFSVRWICPHSSSFLLLLGHIEAAQHTSSSADEKWFASTDSGRGLALARLGGLEALELLVGPEVVVPGPERLLILMGEPRTELRRPQRARRQLQGAEGSLGSPALGTSSDGVRRLPCARGGRR